MKTIIEYMIAAVAAMLLLVGCGHGVPSVEEHLTMAQQAISDGEYHHAQLLCNKVLAVMSTADSVEISEQQAGDLAIMYMKLSEHQESEENVADATLCLRYAMRLSADSLQGFASSLSMEDLGHFLLLRRIGLAVDNPLSLIGEEYVCEDDVANDTTDFGIVTSTDIEVTED